MVMPSYECGYCEIYGNYVSGGALRKHRLLGSTESTHHLDMSECKRTAYFARMKNP